jgi:hypothetical protein
VSLYFIECIFQFTLFFSALLNQDEKRVIGIYSPRKDQKKSPILPYLSRKMDIISQEPEKVKHGMIEQFQSGGDRVVDLVYCDRPLFLMVTF